MKTETVIGEAESLIKSLHHCSHYVKECEPLRRFEEIDKMILPFVHEAHEELLEERKPITPIKLARRSVKIFRWHTKRTMSEYLKYLKRLEEGSDIITHSLAVAD